jgi:hypothetical protein
MRKKEAMKAKGFQKVITLKSPSKIITAGRTPLSDFKQDLRRMFRMNIYYVFTTNWVLC